MLDPRQTAFREAYMNPESDTFSNAYASAKSAGYSEDYATDITAAGNEWFKEIRGDLEMAQEAKRVLRKTLALVDSEEAAKIKIAQDSAKFLGGTVGGLTEKKEINLRNDGGKFETGSMSPAQLAITKKYENEIRESLNE